MNDYTRQILAERLTQMQSKEMDSIDRVDNMRLVLAQDELELIELQKRIKQLRQDLGFEEPV